MYIYIYVERDSKDNSVFGWSGFGNLMYWIWVGACFSTYII